MPEYDPDDPNHPWYLLGHVNDPGHVWSESEEESSDDNSSLEYMGGGIYVRSNMVNFSIYRLALPIYRLTKFLPIYRLRFPISILKMSIYRLARILSIYRLAIRSGFQSIDFSSNLVSLDKISLSCLQDQTLPPPTTKPHFMDPNYHHNIINTPPPTTHIHGATLQPPRE